MEFYGSYKDGGFPDPSNPVGYQTINTYKSAIMHLFLKQKANNEHDINWDTVFTADCADLMKMVKKRKVRIDRKLFKEKVDPALAPYACVVEIERIEEALWFKAHTGGLHTAFCWMRHRFVFLFSLRGLLRCESIFNAELSDLWGVDIPKFRDPHGMYVLLLQFAEGKTNKGQTLFGRCIRHKEPELCPIGALGFYLMARFKLTKEWDTCPDFTVNSAWFRSKLLISGDKEKTTTCMSNDSYGKGIRDVLKQLGLFSKHYIHIGRVLGPKLAEFAEVPAYIIRQLGNWEASIQEKHYSEKLPIEGMRAMGGFLREPGTHHNARTTVKPPDELRKQIFPFVDSALEAVTAKLEEDVTAEGPSTAHGFLKLMDKLRDVILQDAAAMFVKGDIRQKHSFFEEFPVFGSTDFNAYVEFMRESLQKHKDPLDNRLKAALPGMHGKMESMHNDVSELVLRTRTVDTRTANIETQVATQEKKMEKLKVEMAGAFIHIAKCMVDGQVEKLSIYGLRPDATATIGPPATPQQPFPFAAAMRNHATTIETVLGAGTGIVGPVPTRVKRENIDKNHLMREASRFKSCRIDYPPKTLREMYHTYYGIGFRHDQPIKGGMAMLEKLYKSHWRETKGIRQRQHSHCMMLIKGIEAMARSECGGDVEAALDAADKEFKRRKGKVAKMEEWLKYRGYLPKRRRQPQGQLR